MTEEINEAQAELIKKAIRRGIKERTRLAVLYMQQACDAVDSCIREKEDGAKK